MDKYEVAARLGVADSEIVEWRQDDQGVHVLHHDQANHVEAWRAIPAWSIPPAPPVEADVQEAAQPVDAGQAPEPEVKPVRKSTRATKAQG